MTGGFDHDTALLHTVGRRLDHTRADLEEATAAVQATMRDLAVRWGTDSPGTAFGRSYAAAADDVFTALRGHTERVGYAADSLRASARAHEDTDSRVAGTFDALRHRP